MRNRWLAASVLAAAAVVGLAACGGSSSSTPPAASSPKATTGGSSATTTASTSATGIKTASINGHVVLTNSQGFVLYWFAIDTPTTSNCSAQCASFWPPLVGTPTLASGVSLTGKLGTIKRSNGQLQATYDGHPLYLFKSDTSAGMWTGNNLDASGGLWWMMTSTGKKDKHKDTATAPASGSGGSTSSPSSGSGGSGGYGY
jgi:predicted lipoprotein with Yx(FWY)xxD motif